MKKRHWIHQIKNSHTRFLKKDIADLPPPCCLLGELAEAQGAPKATGGKEEAKNIQKNVEERNQSSDQLSGAKQASSPAQPETQKSGRKLAPKQEGANLPEYSHSEYRAVSSGGQRVRASIASSSPSKLERFSSSKLARDSIRYSFSDSKKPESATFTSKGEQLNQAENRKSGKNSQERTFFSKSDISQSASSSSDFTFLFKYSEAQPSSQGTVHPQLSETQNSSSQFTSQNREIGRQNLILQNRAGEPLPNSNRGLLVALLRSPTLLFSLPPALRALYFYGNPQVRFLGSSDEVSEASLSPKQVSELENFSLLANPGINPPAKMSGPDWMKRLGFLMNRFSGILFGSYLTGRKEESRMAKEALFDELSGLKGEAFKKRKKREVKKKRKSDRVKKKNNSRFEEQKTYQ